MLPQPPRSTLFPYTTLFRSSSSGISMPNSSSNAITSSTVSRESAPRSSTNDRSEEHTSELQSLTNLVCRLLLEKKNEIIPALDKNLIVRTIDRGHGPDELS